MAMTAIAMIMMLANVRMFEFEEIVDGGEADGWFDGLSVGVGVGAVTGLGLGWIGVAAGAEGRGLGETGEYCIGGEVGGDVGGTVGGEVPI